MNVLLWHVHGSWTTSFVHGKHRCLLPVDAGRGPYGRGRARTWNWPANAEEISSARLSTQEIDVAVLQRPEEADLVTRWTGRRPGVDLPAVYVEHNTPKGDVPQTRHPMADAGLRIVHVTGFNDLFWDCGDAPTTVVEHGVVEPAARYTGEQARLAVVTNEPVRRGRVTGTDLLPRFAAVAPLDVYGMGVRELDGSTGGPSAVPGVSAHEDPPQGAMHDAIARRRAYLHLCRWTSLGLSLIEAMTIGLPVLALATTEAVVAVPPDAGVLDTRLDTLVDAAHWLIDEPDAAHRLGARARQAALARYSLDRFLADWDRLLEDELCASR